MVDVLLGLKCRIPKEQPCIGHALNYSFIKSTIAKLTPGNILIVSGPAGCGKTFLVQNALNACNKHSIKLDPMKVKINKIDTNNISILKSNVLFMDDIDRLHDLDNSIINKLLETKIVPIVCTCRDIPKRLSKKKEGVVKISLKYVHKNGIIRWLQRNAYSPELIHQYGGDLNAFISRVKLWQSTGWMGNDHEFYVDIEERLKTINKVSLSEAFNVHIDEPGAMCGLIQQNVPRFKKMNIETCADIAGCLSLADVYSTPLYDGLFGASEVYQDLFYGSSIVRLRKFSPPLTIEPGQAWTKHINMIARMNKLLRFKNKNLQYITPDHITTFNMLLSSFKTIDVNKLTGYTIENEDVDIFTKLFTVSKIAPRVKTQFKQALQSMREG